MIQGASIERLEELALLNAVLEGDRVAGHSFVQRYTFTIESCVRSVFHRRRLSVTEDDVRDMVSDIWVSLLEDDKKPLRRFDPARDIRVATWISLLARNKIIDRLRTTHECTVSLRDMTGVLEAPATAPLPAEELEERECQALANQALQDLRPKERRFLEAWYVKKSTPEEIARELNISVATVYSRRCKLQQKLSRTIRRMNRPQRISNTIH
jgi:RNA polymerase sigma-70 factor, ECF subfamily